MPDPAPPAAAAPEWAPTAPPSPPPAHPPGPVLGRVPGPALGPVAPGERLPLLDVLRGVALFGIFMVNMPLFAMPLVEGFGGAEVAYASTRDQVAWWIMTVGFQFKFISLFSLLFGAGFALQLQRAEARGRPFDLVYVRRLLALIAIGLVHALVIWYGDVLVVYGLVGFVLLCFVRVSARWLLRIGTIVLLLSALFGAATGAGQAWAMEAFSEEPESVFLAPAESESAAGLWVGTDDLGPEAVAESELDRSGEMADHSDAGLDVGLDVGPDAGSETSLRGLRAVLVSHFNPYDPIWIEAETVAFRDGPFIDALALRASLWFAAVSSGLFGWLWHVLGLFLIGAGLMKGGFFDRGPEAAARRARLAWLVIPGLALELLAAWLVARNDWEGGLLGAAAAGAHGPAAVVLMLGYVGLISRAVDRAPGSAAVRFLAAPGRMALTVYLSESVLSTFLMYWWGLGWFGSVGRLALIGLVVAIWLLLALAANLWLRRFRIGPAEWLWRWATYGTRPAWRDVGAGG